MIRTWTRLACVLALTLFVAPAGLAQAQDDDAVLRPAEPDFTLISLPSALRLPAMKSAFRITHRFALAFNNGESSSDFAQQLFGLDAGAVIGLEYRIGLAKNLQVGLHHSSDNRDWDFFGQYGVVRQDRGLPVDLSIVASVELIREHVAGTTADFERKSSPSVGVILSRTFGDAVALYVEPTFVSNIFNEFGTAATDDKTLMVGLGARIRVLPTLYVVAETSPRTTGFKANTNHAAFAIEKRVGGHVFQLNASNSFGTTLSQLAMGGGPANNWHLGFNISRKFF